MLKCGKCDSGCDECQPTNPSNKTVIIPVGGVSAFELFKEYNPDYPYSEKYWLEVTQKGEVGDKGDVFIPELTQDYFDI